MQREHGRVQVFRSTRWVHMILHFEIVILDAGFVLEYNFIFVDLRWLAPP